MTMRDLFIVGVNHETAPLAVRERVAFASDGIETALSRLKTAAALDECVILSTCNRVEVYGTGSSGAETSSRCVGDFLREHSALDAPVLQPVLYTHYQPDSVQHLFRVTSGLDSMILGESEIIGQVKHAYALAHRYGATGKVLNTLFQKAFNAAKEIRTQTGLGCGAVSVGSVAIELAEKIFGQLSPHRVLLLGAGTVGQRVLTHLVDRGARHVTVASRSLEHAVQLAGQFRGRVTTFARFHEELIEADIVITATASDTYLVTEALLILALHERRQRPLFLIDLAVPRNIDPRVGQMENVYLYDVDDLQGVVASNQREREQAVNQCADIMQRKVRLFMEWFEHEQELDISDRRPREYAGTASS